MSSVALSLLALAAAAAAQDTSFPATPLYSVSYPHPSDLPYQVDQSPFLIRGPQQGYNLCNSTTQNQDSLCQTMYVNHIDDFCLWAPPVANSTIADTEGEEVAYCVKSGYGTRLMPAGTLQAVQVLITPEYVQYSGFIDQTLLGMQASDEGGELDPHGADLRGNPIGGMVYTNYFESDNSTYDQNKDWNLFIGNGQFCMKICYENGTNPEGFCRNTLDRLGIAYNCNSTPVNGTFEVCSAEAILPGVYTSDGQTITYTQPDESLGAITTVPYTAALPASSNCVTYESSALYTSLPVVSSSAGASGSSGSASSTASASGSRSTGASSASRSGSSASASATGVAETNGVATMHVSAFATIVGVAFAVVFLA